MTQAYVTGGQSLLESTVANMLGITFDSGTIISPTALANVFRRVSPVMVDVPQRVAVTQADGRIEVRFPAGPQRFSAEQLVDFMTFRGQDTEIDRVARQRLGWQAWLEAAGGDAGNDLARAAFLSHGPGPLQKIFAVAGASSPEFQILPVEPAGVGGGEEIYQPKTEEMIALVQRILPGAVPDAAVTGRVKVEIRNGNGRIGVSPKVAGILIPAGYNVVLTDNADNFQHQATDVIFYDSKHEGRARDVVRLIGVGQLKLNRVQSGLADITIIVGKDFQ
jgi:hypothetical protein